MERLVKVWQTRLALDHWDLSVSWDKPSEEDTHAQLTHPWDYDKATVRFAKEWPKWSAEKANRIVAHEVLHIVFREIDHCFNKVIQPQLRRDVDDTCEAAFTHALEGAIDRLAYRLVELAGCA